MILALFKECACVRSFVVEMRRSVVRKLGFLFTYYVTLPFFPIFLQNTPQVFPNDPEEYYVTRTVLKEITKRRARIERIPHVNYMIEPVYSRNPRRVRRNQCSYHLTLFSSCGQIRRVYYVETYIGCLNLIQQIGLPLTPEDKVLNITLNEEILYAKIS
jgi:hypothetical protein